ncbi:hypothetical protein ACGFK1_28040 [Mycobacterium sp. NPDC048908]|uniref:hypothetical protein n=1 Tax=Mycobacterium sp. NPDC048908 TaxID=3364292 RepID=UPI0037227629
MRTLRTASTRLTAAAAAVITATTVAAPAGAAPPGFPDLNGFTEVGTPASYTRPDPGSNGYAYFSTPEGISCSIGSTKWCGGNLPGVPAGTGAGCPSVLQTNEMASRSEPFKFTTSDRPCDAPTDPVLNPGQKLTFEAYGTTCVVGGGGLTACIDSWHDHGFVLQPSGSWVF